MVLDCDSGVRIGSARVRIERGAVWRCWLMSARSWAGVRVVVAMMSISRCEEGRFQSRRLEVAIVLRPNLSL